MLECALGILFSSWILFVLSNGLTWGAIALESMLIQTEYQFFFFILKFARTTLINQQSLGVKSGGGLLKHYSTLNMHGQRVKQIIFSPLLVEWALPMKASCWTSCALPGGWEPSINISDEMRSHASPSSVLSTSVPLSAGRRSSADCDYVGLQLLFL